MLSIVLGIIGGVVTYFLLLFFFHQKRKVFIPSTKWKSGNLKVTILYVGENRVYFRSDDDMYFTASMPIDDFVTEFEPDDTINVSN